MRSIKLQDDMCHFFCEQDNSDKLTIDISFDMSDFESEQEAYNLFGENIYGNGREYLNDIHVNTKYFGSNLSSFHDYLRSYLIGIFSEKRNELLLVTITNNNNKDINEDWLAFFNILVQTFFDSTRDINYGVYMNLNLSRNIVINMMDYFSFLISDYNNRPKDKIDADGNYL
ncbi:hypothetical protein OSH17_08225 [Acinetobacter baumannii]|uniref:hypothetical protein n=1 Tax=Acinetobacter baumannii TaxID=470 RepID=UPI001445E4BA|nr:hypothetical protein [Acinetobacter baumannii]EKT9892084.1 hypothetical protein [Acinetobacter baumannii]EKT9964663.1 hypothetical protein [Acinetobacter baumannii]EKW3631625.1 hypothetical protein [Acinetobacter baumannii]EKW3730589.1 hypothetical protein [Acinetobacter baumannii]EKW5783885.1 hypothetical protein [Acinetobacter baumannii]